jgi:hypothetical protein
MEEHANYAVDFIVTPSPQQLHHILWRIYHPIRPSHWGIPALEYTCKKHSTHLANRSTNGTICCAPQCTIPSHTHWFRIDGSTHQMLHQLVPITSVPIGPLTYPKQKHGYNIHTGQVQNIHQSSQTGPLSHSQITGRHFITNCTCQSSTDIIHFVISITYGCIS